MSTLNDFINRIEYEIIETFKLLRDIITMIRVFLFGS